MAHFEIDQLVQSLHAVRREWRESQNRSQEPGGRELPSRDAVAEALEQLKGALFPMRLGPHDLRQESEDLYVGHTLDLALNTLMAQAQLELRTSARQHGLPRGVDIPRQAQEAIQAFARSLPEIRRLLPDGGTR